MRTTTRATDQLCTHNVRLIAHCEDCDGPLTNEQRRLREDLDLLGAQTNRLAQVRMTLNSLIAGENRSSRPTDPVEIGDVVAELEALASGILDVAHDMKDMAR